MDVALLLLSEGGTFHHWPPIVLRCVARDSWLAASFSADPIIFSLWVRVNEFSQRSKVMLPFPGVHPARTTFP